VGVFKTLQTTAEEQGFDVLVFVRLDEHEAELARLNSTLHPQEPGGRCPSCGAFIPDHELDPATPEDAGEDYGPHSDERTAVCLCCGWCGWESERS
jgi:hypothetical protein